MGLILGKYLWARYSLIRFVTGHFFRKQCRDPLKTQRNFLETLLQRHQDTSFGKKYRFDTIHSIQDFQERVPVHSWSDIEPYVEEVKSGNKSALFSPSEKLLMFATTSGTTGTPKFIPVTDWSFRLYGKYWALTWGNVIREAPTLFSGKILYFPGDPEEGRVNGIPYGAITGRAYSQQSYIIRPFYPYPFEVCRIQNYASRYYTIMRIAVERTISFIGIANPSTILTLFHTAKERRKDIIDDIRHGDLRYTDQMPRGLGEQLQRKLRPNPKRADQLEEIYQKTGDFLPCHYWQGLAAIVCFSSGLMELYLRQLNSYVGKIPIFNFGILASEGRFSFPLRRYAHELPQGFPKQLHEESGSRDNRRAGDCLTIKSNFFEFIPEDEVDLPNRKVLTVDKLEVGKRYFIVITNASGLYRYHISDVVEVTGFYEKTPLIIFCNKGEHFSSVTGEKLTEYQVVEALRTAGESLRYFVGDFFFCLNWNADLPHYSLLMSSVAHGNDRETLNRLVNEVEKEIMKANIEYESKRKSLRLGPLTLKLVEGTGLEDYKTKKALSARNLSQHKTVFLISDPEFEKQFQFCLQIESSL